VDKCDTIAKEGTLVFNVVKNKSIRIPLPFPENQIMDLENRNAALQEELSLSPARRTASQVDWVPRAPAAHVLTGHRSPVTRVAFHPQYSIIASASEDATVKIWDWETGEFERTLKGHTKAIMDVDFDHKGHLLGELPISVHSWDVS
jgi:platelet-activating factor acetylhydrolase IB subunit alpha